jgi:putative ABC transport system permease protein
MSISISLILIAYLFGEFAVDKSLPELDRIHRVVSNDNNFSIREDFREYLLNTYPEIDDACRYNNYPSNITFENNPFKGKMIVTDTSFFDIFSISFIAGNKSSLAGPDYIILTESFARNIFGNTDPLGKTLLIEYEFPLIVSGIVKDFPENSSIRGDYFTNSVKKTIYEGWSDGKGNDVNYYRLFVLIAGNADVKGLSMKVSTDVKGIKYSGGYKMDKINFMPFRDSYFSTGSNRTQTSHANLKLIKLLLIVATLIVLLAIFNYINLTTASHIYRYKEIAIKKTSGAGRLQIFQQFMFESFILCFISFLLALYLSSFLKPFIEKFLGSNVDFYLLYKPLGLALIIAGILALTFVSGFYPAYSISGLKPVYILSKRDSFKISSIGLRSVLNILQNTVSISLIIALIILSRQIGFVRTRNYGFDTEKLLRIDVHWRLKNKAVQIRERLLAYPTIKDVCFTNGSPGSIYSYSSWDVNGYEGNMYELSVDSSFFKVFQVPILMGRKALPSDFNKVCYINETAFKTSGWETFTGEKYHGMEIIGIVKDFHFDDLYNKISPLAIQLTSEMSISHMTMSIGTDDLPGTIDILRKTWDEICPGHELKYQFYDEWLDSMYKNEEKLSAAISFFAVFAIIISCLGIFGITEYTIRRKTKEIGIRKVNGASTSEIIFFLSGDIIRWSLIGFFLALAPVWYIMDRWLETFAYRTQANWWIFVLAGLLSMAISLLTVSWQSWMAATRNPIEALRYE